jgi:hypothetical protein
MRPVRTVLVTASAIGLLLAPAAAARPLDKLDGQLKDLATGKRPHAKQGAGAIRPRALKVTRSGEVLVDVYVHGAMAPAANALRREGMRVQAISGRSPQRMVEGYVPVSALDDVAALRSTKAVLPVADAIFNTGSVLSQGDAVHRGPQTRALGPTGSGIPVGIISDSISRVGGGVADSQASGNLPAAPNVVVLQDPPSGGSDEGRAMAEIVYDTAPGIPKILFSRGGGGAAVRAASIDALVANGAKVIADDVVYLTEPFFQDGIIAQAADRATANGTAYFVSAGNRARQSWDGVFTPSSVPTEADFDTGAGEDRRQTFATLGSGQTATIVVQWDDPFGASQSDFAIDIYRVSNETAPALSTTTNNIATGFPVETASFINPDASATTFSLAIRRVGGGGNNPTPRLKWIFNGPSSTSIPSEHSTNSQAIDPDASSARGALTVAAVAHNDPGNNTAESFSSRGPAVARYFDVAGNRLAAPDIRVKPDIAGADGVATSVPGFASFFGTSAAAPSAAGIGALLLSAKPSLPVEELYAIMRDPRGAIDCTSAALYPDDDCGFGFILGDGKLNMVLDSTAPSVGAVTAPAAPDGANGWFHSNVGVAWNANDAESPVGIQSGCVTQLVTTDGATAFTCSATSAGGTTSQPVTIKRDSVPPSAPSFTGITAGAFAADKLPAPNAIGCSATDATSGVTSCVVSGFSAVPGSHTLTATATDQSGLTSSSTLTYTVKPFAAGGLKVVGRQTIRSVLSSGFKVTLTVATNATTLKGPLKVGKKTVGTLKTKKSRGKATLKIKLNKAGKKLLARAGKAKFVLTVTATSPNGSPATLTVSRALKR